MPRQRYKLATQKKAQDMIDDFNADPIFPIHDPNGYRMNRWADEPQEHEDGEWSFERQPEELLTARGIGQAKRDAMLAKHNPKIVDVDENMSPLKQEEMPI